MAQVENTPPAFAATPPKSDGLVSLIPYKNSRALASYYLGIFSLIPVLGVFLGPAALILGTQGYEYARRRPEAQGKAHAVIGTALGALTTLANWGVVLVVLLLLLASSLTAR